MSEREILKKYIFGEITQEEDLLKLEERLLTDAAYFEELSILEDELIGDYIEEKFDPKEKDAFEKRFLRSEENRQRLNFMRALLKSSQEFETEKGSEKKRSFFDSFKGFFLSPLPIAGVVLFLLVTTFLVWQVFLTGQSESMVAFNEAFDRERPVESRITDLKYAPFRKKRGGAESGNINKEKFEIARLSANKDLGKNRTAENLHNIGRISLAEKRFDDAIAYFEEALKISPNEAKLYNDLGSARLEKGRLEGNDLKILGAALGDFDKAIKLNENLNEAYFNKSLVLQLMNLPNEAKSAWQTYLKIDSSSKWADEARKNLQNLEIKKTSNKTRDEIRRDFLEAYQNDDRERSWQILSRTREIVKGKLIPQQLAFLFIEASAGNRDTEAKKYLEALNFAGALESEKAHDPFWQKVAGFYSAITKTRVRQIKQAHDLMRKGFEMYDQGKYELAGDSFMKCREILTGEGNIWEAKLCDYWIGSSLFYSNQIDRSTEIYKGLAAFAETENFNWLASHAYSRLVYDAQVKNRKSKAIEFARKSLQFAKETNDVYNLRKASSQIAELYKQLGRHTEALEFLEKSLEISRLPDMSPNQKWLEYEAVAETFHAIKLYEAAVVFEREALALAKDLGRKDYEHFSNVNLGMIYTSQKDYPKAKDFLELSKKTAGSLADRENREKATAYSSLKLGYLHHLTGEYEKASEEYEKALEFFETSEFKLDRYETHKGLLLTYFAAGNNPAFERELPLILEIFKKYRSEIIEEQNRNSFFDNEQSVYDTAIEFEYQRKNYQKAFDYSEESRSRSLLDLIDKGGKVSDTETNPELQLSSFSAEPLKLAELQARLPEKIQIVQYSVLPDKILIWFITRKSFSITETNISAGQIREDVSEFVALVSRSTTEKSENMRLEQLAGGLYRELIGPVEGNMSDDKIICFVPDKILFRLPFASLKPPGNEKKYLIEKYGFLTASSTNTFLISTKNSAGFNRETSEKLLSIGNPDFSRKDFPDLPELDSAEREALKITEFYPDSKSLTGREAVKENVEKNLSQANIIHFAGHYVVDENSTLLSGLVLAKDGEKPERENSILANYEIIERKLPNTKLILLSACRTGVEKFYQGEGAIGAARTFLALGVPLVIASQWEVESDATSELMIRFHRYRKSEKISAIEALRRSQLDLLYEKEFQHPSFWAGFTVFGGYAEF